MIDANGQPVMTAGRPDPGLHQPDSQFASRRRRTLTADIVLGTINQVGNEIDEFVTGTLRNNLLGLPLDLAALNIARGRDTGVAPLNLVRNAALQPDPARRSSSPTRAGTTSAVQLKHIESLVNFIAAYGTHSQHHQRATTIADKRAAAQALVANGTLGSADVRHRCLQLHEQPGRLRPTTRPTPGPSTTQPAQRRQWSTGSVTGLDNVDMWIGGLAEKQNLFGGVLGSTFEYIFRTQMEALQDGDRLYYLPRIEGMDYEESLQDSSLAADDPGEHRHQAPARQHLPDAGIHGRGERLLRQGCGTATSSSMPTATESPTTAIRPGCATR